MAKVRNHDVATHEPANKPFCIEVCTRIGNRLNLSLRFVEFTDLLIGQLDRLNVLGGSSATTVMQATVPVLASTRADRWSTRPTFDAPGRPGAAPLPVAVTTAWVPPVLLTAVPAVA